MCGGAWEVFGGCLGLFLDVFWRFLPGCSGDVLLCLGDVSVAFISMRRC